MIVYSPRVADPSSWPTTGAEGSSAPTPSAGGRAGRAMVLGYQTGGEASTGSLDPDPRKRWRLLFVDEIDTVTAARGHRFAQFGVREGVHLLPDGLSLLYRYGLGMLYAAGSSSAATAPATWSHGCRFRWPDR